MFKVETIKQFTSFHSALFFMSALMLFSPANAEEELIGSGEYFNSCASCHGVSAKGDGNLSRYLNIEPTDLTRLSKNNGGEYPFLRVFQIIDGRSQLPVHGGRLMPIWGDRYATDNADKHGGSANEAVVRARILELVYYIQSIQQK